jgi:hypothetical protein
MGPHNRRDDGGDAEMVAFGLNVRVHHLEVKVLRRLRLAGDAPVIEVKQAAKEMELIVGVERVDLNEVAELLLEGFDALMQTEVVALDL